MDFAQFLINLEVIIDRETKAWIFRKTIQEGSQLYNIQFWKLCGIDTRHFNYFTPVMRTQVIREFYIFINFTLNN